MIAAHRILIIFCLFTGYFNQLHAQQLVFDAQHLPLEKALQQVQQQFDYEFSYNPEIISDCQVNLKGSYPNKDALLHAILHPCQLSFQKLGNVYIIRSSFPPTPVVNNDTLKLQRPEKKWHYQGQVLDDQSKDPLPYAQIKISDKGILTDANGFFSFQSTDSILIAEIRYLGYTNRIDSLRPNDKAQLLLSGATSTIASVLIEARRASIPVKQSGESPGMSQFNHRICDFLPGNSNNSIFNLLRLQAGVLAAGEQSQDYMVWGSYKGQSHIIFDGITMFSNSSLNEQIGSINPDIIKDLRLYKAAYQVDIGDRIGAVVDILSKDGQQRKFQTQFHLNNQLASAYVNIPLRKHAELQVALRAAYPDGFQSKRFRQFNATNYRDGTLIYKHRLIKGNQLKFTGLLNQDRTVYQFEKETDSLNFFELRSIVRNQSGFSLQHEKQWKKWGQTHQFFAMSQLASSYSNKLNITNRQDRFSSSFAYNRIHEYRYQLQHEFPANELQQFSAGMGLIAHHASYSLDSTNLDNKNIADAARLKLFAKDRMQLAKALTLTLGLRADLPLRHQALPRLGPRAQLTYQPDAFWKLHAAYGWQHQFLVENPIIDQLGNFQYVWNIAGVDSIPIPDSHQGLLGISFRNQYFFSQLEPYFKYSRGLSQFTQQADSTALEIQTGQSRAYGIDWQGQFLWQGHQFGLAYSLAKVEQRFGASSNFEAAPQDQRHELKFLSMLDFNPFFCSLSYIYGSGFPYLDNLLDDEIPNYYSRLDIALSYQKVFKKSQLTISASVLNLLNQKNVQFNNFSNFPNNEKTFIPAIPLSPMLDLKFSF